MCRLVRLLAMFLAQRAKGVAKYAFGGSLLRIAELLWVKATGLVCKVWGLELEEEISGFCFRPSASGMQVHSQDLGFRGFSFRF